MKLPSWLWLLAGALLLPFAGHQTTVAVAAWLAPVFLLRFSRSVSHGWIAWAGIALAYAFGAGMDFRNGLVPLPLPAIVVLALVTGMIRAAGYAVDRAVARRLPGIAGSLAFPAAMTAMEWLATRPGPFGTWGSTAYSQSGNLPLLQIVSVTGLWGVTFLIHWLASAVNPLMEGTPGRALRPAAAFAAALMGVLLFGGARLAFSPPDAPPVPVAAVALSVAEYDGAFAEWKAGDLARAPQPDRAAVHPRLATVHALLLARTEAAARAGARIVSWPESTPVLAEDLDGLLARGADVARRHRLHLLMTPWVIRRTDRFPYVENLSVLVDPAGRVLWRYPKTHPVPGIEDSRFGTGPGVVPLAASPHGSLASVICFDLDFPWLVRQAGSGGAGLLMAPSDDWPAIRETHARMAVFRAVENGTSLLRATNNGVSVAVDPLGRVLGSVETRADAAPLLLSALPVAPAFTLYSRTGDWFAWLCVAAVVVLGILARRERRRPAVPQSWHDQGRPAGEAAEPLPRAAGDH